MPMSRLEGTGSQKSQIEKLKSFKYIHLQTLRLKIQFRKIETSLKSLHEFEELI